MMNKVKVFIDKFLKSEDIRSVLFTPHSAIGLKSHSREIELIGESVSPSGSINFFKFFLGEEAYEKVKADNVISQEFKLEDQLISLDGFLSSGGLTFTLTKKGAIQNNVEDYPQMITNFLTQSSGLVIGVHKKQTEISQIERDLFNKKVDAQPTSSIYFRNKKELPVFNKLSFIINAENEDKTIFNSINDDINVVRYGALQNLDDMKRVNSYLSSGSFVFAHICASRVLDAIVKLQSLLGDWESKYLMSQNLVGFYSFLNWTQDSKLNYAFECYPFSSEAKSSFHNMESIEFFEFFEDDFKKNGLSFTQSIHTKVLKRSINLRKAFEIAPDPSDLDYILKKSGI